MKKFFRIKHVKSHHNNSDLHPVLTTFDLTLLGIGAIIGAGVFVLTGVAAATKAGPAICLSYVLAGCAALFAALSYAELASSVGGSGSAYGYAYTSVGELFAWIIGWALILEYTVSVSTVAVGWSGYVLNGLSTLNINLPDYLSKGPGSGGIINLPAMLIVSLLIFFLCAGVRHSATLNMIIVIIKLLTIAFFIVIAAGNVKAENWVPFFPFGYDGVVKGAAIVFFAYIGFDALSTTAEETINPQRSLPIGIILSLVICTIIYIIVSILLTGIAHYTTLNNASPVAYSLLSIGYPIATGIVSIGAIAGLTTVMLVMYFGLTRIIFAISRDGLLPKFFSKVNAKTKTPTNSIIFMGIVIALIAGLVPLSDLAELVNIGTLTAFIFVCLGVIILRKQHPDLQRPFKLPLNPLIPSLGVILCVYLISNLSFVTWQRFSIWMIVGLVVYFIYGQFNSNLDKNNK
ncbi:amino acid permease [Gammaproteobacteria bacterium]|nr:amino acid permease [Gammaproteobacteria bacterium]